MIWKEFIEIELKQEYMINLSKYLANENKDYNIYPPKKDIFKAYELTELDKIKVVILGQDCYHGKDQAMGLSFSVNNGIAIPPSLRNIFKEIKNDLNIDMPNHGCLEQWSENGVFLLNAALTVREKAPGSHLDIWQQFTDKTIGLINEQDRHIVYILWGNFAKSKKYLITNKKHIVIIGSHPSPLSAHTGFFGGRYFSKANKFLTDNGVKPIDWKII